MSFTDAEVAGFIESLPSKSTIEFGADKKRLSAGRKYRALQFHRKYGLPPSVAVQLSQDKKKFKAFQRHTFLNRFLSNLPSRLELPVKGTSVYFQPVYVNAGGKNIGTSHELPTLFDLVDIYGCVYFSSDDKVADNLSKGIADTTKGLPAGIPRYGSFAYLDISIPRVNSKPSLLVVDAQARRRFWNFPSAIRAKYAPWYNNAVVALGHQGRLSGLEQIVIPTNDLVQEALYGMYGHTAPSTILNQFYDNFAQKRGYTLSEAKIQHPLNGICLETLVWVKQIT